MIRSTKTWQAVALTAVAGLALSACGTTDTDGGSAGGEGGVDAAGGHDGDESAQIFELVAHERSRTACQMRACRA